MSTFVELPIGEYSPSAFSNFDAAQASFNLGNALALMWTCQLAYETGKPRTIDAVGKLWKFSSLIPFAEHKVDLVASFDTTGIVGERADAIVLAFAGTDPAVWETLATDFNLRLSAGTDTHIGFQAALDATQPVINRAVILSQQTKKPLYISGHSLGGALAVLAASYADTRGVAPTAVYTYGMPRSGGTRFQGAYNANGRLGAVTYRLVHGQDVVARIPMSALGYRHVGGELECESGAKFKVMPLSPLASDIPEFSLGLAHTLLSNVEGLLSGHALSPPGPGTFGPLLKFLPQPIRDHLQDRYILALTP